MDQTQEVEMPQSSSSQEEMPFCEVVVKQEPEHSCVAIENLEDSEYQPPFEETDLEWLPEVFSLIEVSDDGYVSGYVRSEEDLNIVLHEHAKNTESMFGLDSDDGLRKLKRHRRLFYYSKLLDLASHITSSDRCRTYICNFGMRYTPTKKYQEGFSLSEHHDYTKDVEKKKLNTSKTGCPAKIAINEISVYTDYGLDGLSRRLRQEKISALKEALIKDPSAVRCEKYIHIKLPLKCTHRGHIVSEREWKAKKTHPLLLKKIEELTLMGIRKISIFKALLKAYAEESLIEGNAEDVRDLPYFFPNEKTIENKMRSVIRQHGLSLIKVGKGKNISKPLNSIETSKVRCVIRSNGSNIMRFSRSKKEEGE